MIFATAAADGLPWRICILSGSTTSLWLFVGVNYLLASRRSYCRQAPRFHAIIQGVPWGTAKFTCGGRWLPSMDSRKSLARIFGIKGQALLPLLRPLASIPPGWHCLVYLRLHRFWNLIPIHASPKDSSESWLLFQIVQKMVISTKFEQK